MTSSAAPGCQVLSDSSSRPPAGLADHRLDLIDVDQAIQVDGRPEMLAKPSLELLPLTRFHPGQARGRDPRHGMIPADAKNLTI